MNEFAKRNFNLILFLSTIIGFVLPQPGEAAGLLILGILCFIIFASSFKVDFSPAFFRSQAQTIFLFYVLRFLLLPVAFFWVVYPFSAVYGTCLFLLAVLPVGVTAPAFTNVFGGNITLALALLILSSTFTPVVLPYLGGLLMADELNVDLFKLFATLFITVILPYAAHLPLRKYRGISLWMQAHDSFISIVGIALLFALAIAEYRPMLLKQTALLIPYFAGESVGFGFFVFVWLVCFAQSIKGRQAGFAVQRWNQQHRVGCGHQFPVFSTAIGVFFVVCQIMWVLILIPVRRVMAKVAGV